MRVRATQLGYFNDRRMREGDEFDLPNPEKEFSRRWMEPVDDKSSAQADKIDQAREAARAAHAKLQKAAAPPALPQR